MSQWNSLFCSFEKSFDLRLQLKNFLSDCHYEAYDAFGLMPGKAYPHTLKLFIAPASGHWARILVSATDQDIVKKLAQSLSAQGTCLYIDLRDDKAIIEVYRAGKLTPPEIGLENSLGEGKSINDIKHALAGKIQLMPLDDSNESSQVLNLDDLPDDMKKMAQSINPAHADKMFAKLSKNLVGKQSEEASQLLDADKLDWNNSGGMQIRALMACLAIGNHWRNPDFETLRAAYQRHARLKRKPDARLYAGDESAMASVPDALDYIPVYGGKDS